MGSKDPQQEILKELKVVHAKLDRLLGQTDPKAIRKAVQKGTGEAERVVIEREPRQRPRFLGQQD